MADSGTTSGPEILVALSPEADEPLWVQLGSALRTAVRSGRLAPGQRLPASRVLAADLGVSRRLVVDVYDQLTAEGYLTARAGSGTWVCDLPPATGPARTAAEGSEPRSPRWDLRPGVPSLAHFPRQQWRRAWQSALGGASDADLGYPHAAGHPRLRQAVAGYLTRVRGVAATPETTLICSGFTQGLDLLCRTLYAAGARTVALEDPGLPHRAPVIRRAGLTPIPVPVDAEGLVVAALPGGGADAVLTTPAHQFPTGAVLAPHRREALLAWAGRTGALVLEDDYDGEFRFDRRAIGALQGLAPDSVVYLGSTSKALSPALRLGWLVAPSALVEPLTAGKFLTDHGTAALDQLALTELIGSGAYDRHIRQSRTRYKARREALQAAVHRYGVPLRLTGVPAGVQTLAALPEGQDADALVRRSAAEGIALDSVTRYRLTPAGRPGALVLGYGNITPHGIDQAMAILARLMAAGRGTPDAGPPRP